MSKRIAPWIRNRGLSRLLAQETNVSDLIQFLSDRDPTPWSGLVGFVPDTVEREALRDNHADLLLTSDTRTAVVEVKLGHLMSNEQQDKYEALRSAPDLYLAALKSDEARLASASDRWAFLSLSELISHWAQVDDDLAAPLAREAASILRRWDQMISGVFEPRSSDVWTPLTVLDQKFLARVVTRRVAQGLRARKRLVYAGVTSGGGLPLVQGWTPIRDEGSDRAFMAEIRWWQAKPGGELRFGVDFDPRPDTEEDEEVRRAAYDLARSMDSDITFDGLRDHLLEQRPDLAALLRREKRSRPAARGDWEQVIVRGFKGLPRVGGKKTTRQNIAPDFFGDGALRFQAIVEIDFENCDARDLTALIDCTLGYLSARQPETDGKEPEKPTS